MQWFADDEDMDADMCDSKWQRLLSSARWTKPGGLSSERESMIALVHNNRHWLQREFKILQPHCFILKKFVMRLVDVVTYDRIWETAGTRTGRLWALCTANMWHEDYPKLHPLFWAWYAWSELGGNRLPSEPTVKAKKRDCRGHARKYRQKAFCYSTLVQ